MRLLTKYKTKKELLALGAVPHPVDPEKYPEWRDEADGLHRACFAHILYKTTRGNFDWDWHDTKWADDIVLHYSNPTGQLRRGADEEHWPGKPPLCWARQSRDMLTHFLAGCCFESTPRYIGVEQCIRATYRPFFFDKHRYKNQSNEDGKPAFLGPDFLALRERAAGRTGLLSSLIRHLGDIHLCIDSFIWNRREKNDINSHFVMSVAAIHVKPTIFSILNLFILDLDKCEEKLVSYHTYRNSIKDFVGPIRCLISKLKHGDKLW